MSELTLFPLETPLLFQRGSGTSKDAARDFAKKARTVREMVHLYLVGRGSKGATYTEIMAGTNLCSGTVCARLKELRGGTRGDLPVKVVATVERRGKATVYVSNRFYRGTVAA